MKKSMARSVWNYKEIMMNMYKVTIMIIGGKIVTKRYHADSKAEVLGWCKNILDVLVIGIYQINELDIIIG